MKLRSIQRFFRMTLVGGLATGVDLGLLVLLVEVFKISPTAANVPAYLTSLLVQFFGIRNHVFQAQRNRMGPQMVGFIGVEGVTGLLNVGIFHLLVTFTSFPYLAIRIGGTFLVFILFSYPMWHWVFEPKNRLQTKSIS